MVEQNSVMALAVSDQCYILDDGNRMKSIKDLDGNKELKRNWSFKILSFIPPLSLLKNVTLNSFQGLLFEVLKQV
jgi:hypothetical protein